MGYLLAKDTLNGAEGTIVIERDGKNIVVGNMKNIRTEAEIQSNDMKVVGTRKIQAKNTGVKQTGKGKIYYGSNILVDMILEYINTGVMPEFNLQITNNDPTTGVGSQVMAYYGCTLTGTIPLSILDSEETMLNHDFSFTYTNVQRLQAFNDTVQLGN